MLNRIVGRIVVAGAAVVAVVLAGHRLIPAMGGFTPVLESLLPWLGWAVPLLLGAAALARSRLAAVAALVPGLVWAVMFGPALLRSSPGGRSDLSVGTVNVGVTNDSSGTAVRTIADGLDLLAAQELTSGGPAAKRLNTLFPHHYTVSTVGLWSRYPIRQSKPLDVGMGWVRAFRAVVDTPKGDVTVYVMHLASARPGQTASRDESLAAARRLIDADTSKRILLLGDLNTATTDRGMRGLTPPLLNAQQEAGQGFGFTWPSSFPITRPDHILYKGMTATEAGVAPATGSDHRAATASFRL
ncbi:endonuclease/exonuclease/phosphatase family protein [Nonomuraea roseoviolacea subsp. roseoviolacea]|uniref:Vancomycin resistance protein VanJ n=1 Tax=Nonomuraea roseoviolacea subsp. carminata TaxID=160689 RepID=A0ABT1JSL9_9ACTN|nr:endonuclease/exonuclease/phosphatase family protein [Nonomuraea roseoviolacea]MCP2344319.1 vancomycin resistance protein VanJ [Nonomuraea roseoviolacea subsp. carminata]